jgi:septal ring-binding cell division protein DamX
MSEGGQRSGRSGDGPRELAVSALLVGATVIILGAGGLLRSGPEREHPASATVASSPPAVPVETAPDFPPQPRAAGSAPETIAPMPAPPATPSPRGRPAASAPVVPPPGSVGALARRAVADVARIGRARGRWTAQVLVACREDTVERLTGKVPAAAPLYLLPVEIRGEPCFRACWGDYPSRAEAGRARDLPAVLRGGEPVRPVEIVKVLP